MCISLCYRGPVAPVAPAFNSAWVMHSSVCTVAFITQLLGVLSTKGRQGWLPPDSCPTASSQRKIPASLPLSLHFRGQPWQGSEGPPSPAHPALLLAFTDMSPVSCLIDSPVGPLGYRESDPYRDLLVSHFLFQSP